MVRIEYGLNSLLMVELTALGDQMGAALLNPLQMRDLYLRLPLLLFATDGAS